jgi:hypothetical protein
MGKRGKGDQHGKVRERVAGHAFFLSHLIN